MNKTAKVIVIIVAIIIFMVVGFIGIKSFLVPTSYLSKIEEVQGRVTDYAIYGTHYNISGEIKNVKEPVEAYLVLKNDEEEIPTSLIWEIVDGVFYFNSSNNINTGLNLESLLIGDYSLLIKTVYTEDEFNYYTLVNGTKYSSLEYYTLSQNGEANKIDISFKDVTYKEDKIIPTLNFLITKTTLPEDVYDIVLDPGHGGDDPGAVGSFGSTTYKEAEVNLRASLLIKEKLESLGYKVLLTRESDVYVPPYGERGRATLANTVKAKFSFTIHSNSNIENTWVGTEIYLPLNADMEFAQVIAKNIVETAGTSYSNYPKHKVLDGVYLRTFTLEEIEDSANEANEKGYTPYTMTTNTNYYFMLREVGGVSTGALADGRNAEYDPNPYYLSNNTAEAYIIEMGYLNNESNATDLVNNTDNYAQGFVNGLVEYFKKNSK